MKRQAAWLLPVLLLGLATLVFVGLRITRPEPPRATPQERIQRVTAVTIEPTSQHPQITLHARVEAPRQATLEAAVIADVLDVQAREGLQVARGTTLLSLDTRELDFLLTQRQAEVDEISAQIDLERQRHASDELLLLREQRLLELANAEVKRAEELLASRAGSRTLLDQAQEKAERQTLALHTREREVADHPARLAQLQARLQRASALRNQAQLDRQRAHIQAPFSGRIVRVNVSPGDRVRPGDPLIEIYANDELELRAQIPFRHLPAIRQGLTEGGLSASASLDGQPLQAHLHRLAGETRHGGAEALFSLAQTTPPGLLPGRLIALQLTLPTEPHAVALPVSALYGLEQIYRINNERLESIQVERLGEQYLSDTTLILVRSPQLQNGDWILTTQLANAVSGLKVMVLEETTEQTHALATRR